LQEIPRDHHAALAISLVSIIEFDGGALQSPIDRLDAQNGRRRPGISLAAAKGLGRRYFSAGRDYPYLLRQNQSRLAPLTRSRFRETVPKLHSHSRYVTRPELDFTVEVGFDGPDTDLKQKRRRCRHRFFVSLSMLLYGPSDVPFRVPLSDLAAVASGVGRHRLAVSATARCRLECDTRCLDCTHDACRRSLRFAISV
jgi:hypothetical protein